MLDDVKRVTRNEAAEGINIVLDKIGNSAEKPVAGAGAGAGAGTNQSISDAEKQRQKTCETIYQTTLAVLWELQNHRLWMSTAIRLAKLYLGNGNLDKFVDLNNQMQKNGLHATGEELNGQMQRNGLHATGEELKESAKCKGMDCMRRVRSGTCAKEWSARDG
jgi:hypothetical protein